MPFRKLIAQQRRDRLLTGWMIARKKHKMSQLMGMHMTQSIWRSAAFAILNLALMLVGGSAHAADSRFVTHDPARTKVVVFVHGVLGDGTNTWQNTETKAYWPAMMAADRAFADANVYVYEFPSSTVGRSLSVNELAEAMRRRLQGDGVLKHDELVFLSHSLGGLVTRAFLVKYRDSAAKVRMAYFFATPTEGSPSAMLAALASRNPQFKSMYPLQSDNYLADLQRDWLAARLGIRSFCAYEGKTTYGVLIVDQRSATSLCTESLDPIGENHIDIVKPRNTGADSYIAFRNAYESVLNDKRSGPGTAAPPVASASRPIPDFRPGARRSVRDYLSYLQAYPRLREENSNRCLSWQTDLLDVDNGKLTIRNYEYMSATCSAQGIRITERTCVADLGNVDDQIVLLSSPKIEVQCLSGECFTCDVRQMSRVPPSLDFSAQILLAPERLKAVSVFIGAEPPILEKIPRFSPFARSVSRLLSNGDDKKFCQRNSIYCQ